MNGLIVWKTKHFDNVSHKLLLRMFCYYKVNKSVILWIGSFLCNRKQRVKIDGFHSDSDVLNGIRRGTILGSVFYYFY